MDPNSVGKKAKCSSCQNVFVIRSLGRAAHPAAAPTPTPVVTSKPKYLAKQQAKRKQAEFNKANAKGKRNKEKTVSRPAPQIKANQQIAQKKIHQLNLLLANRTINPGRPSFMYRINILITTFVMLLLPVIYFCMIVCLVYGIYWHAANNIGMIGAVRGRGAILTVIGYVLPIFAGVVLVFFMLKPLIAAPGETSRSRKINESGEPVLFWFVQQVCEIVGAPKPKQIFINHDINAAASFENGLKSALFSGNMSLHIGVPLVAGLNLQQFGGVLAHEFGHFSQGAGMRLSAIIRSISFWFARIVYERDAWDDALEEMCDEDVDFRFAILIMFVQLAVFITRAILWVLLMIGHTVSCFLLRQMEYDADKYEIQFAGSEAFVETAKQLVLLNVVYGNLIPTIIESAYKKKTVKNLPKSIVSKRDKLEARVMHKILSDNCQTPGIFDTHPTDEQRIAKANLADAAGVFRCNAPAGLLFSNFELTCEGITDDFYRNNFGVGKEMIRKPRKRAV